MARYTAEKQAHQADDGKVGGVTPENLKILRERLKGVPGGG